ncbi:MAG: EutN/CcmL family microcompartment protein [Thermoguttaceae bacterium]|jgi:ethanolamine utilization protein EutN
MLIARVTGSLVATQKVHAMVGHKMLVVEPYRLDPQTRAGLVSTGRSMVAVDTVGAGLGEMVLITQGSSARLTPETKNLPVDTVVIGIIDTVHVDHTCVYDKEPKPCKSTKH